MRKILHISNTDIEADSRIRKELLALRELSQGGMTVIGVPDSSEEGESIMDGARYIKLRVVARLMRALPRVIRYTVELIEFTVKAFRAGRSIKPHVVHCHDTFALPAGWLLKRIHGCRLVYDAHELESNKNGQNIALSFATLMIEKAVWSHIDLLISVSNSILNWYDINLGFKRSILVLNSPVITKVPELERSAIRSAVSLRGKFGIPDDQLVVLYLGILARGRGIGIALEAFASSSLDAHLVFVGRGELTPLIQSYCEKHPNIHLHEPVSHDQVVDLVSDADVGLCLVENVSLSDYFCLPNKLFEYGFAGLHVLASDFPEIRKVVEQYAFGTCCALEPSKVREAIQLLIEHRPVGRQVDLSDLRWVVQAERLVRSYREMLASTPTLQGAELGN